MFDRNMICLNVNLCKVNGNPSMKGLLLCSGEDLLVFILIEGLITLMLKTKMVLKIKIICNKIQ